MKEVLIRQTCDKIKPNLKIERNATRPIQYLQCSWQCLPSTNFSRSRCCSITLANKHFNIDEFGDFTQEFETLIFISLCKFKNVLDIGIPRGVQKGHFPLPERNWDYKTKISWQLEVSTLIPIHGFNSCNDCIFAGMTLTPHKSEKPGSLFWCHAVMSLQFTHVPLLCLHR